MRSLANLLFRCFVALVLVLLGAGCASHLPALGTSDQAFTPASDEALLWERAAHEHRKLRGSSTLLRDPVLEEYLAEVTFRLVPERTSDAGVTPSVHVLINPSLNAFAYPTGAIYVHSGLMAHLENEAQLATVLAHEIAHIVHRHAIRHLREERNKDLWKRIAVVTAPLVLGPLLAPLGVSVGGANPIILLQRPSIEYFLADQALDSSLDLSARRPAKGRFDQTVALFARTQPQLALLASVQNYQSSLMEEADRFTITALVQAGYDPEEADRTLARLHQVASAQAAQEPFWWGRPAVLEARRRILHKAMAALPRPESDQRPQVSRRERYPERIRLLLRENALAELKIGRSDAAIAQLERALSLYPHDATAHYYRGRAYAAKAATTDDLQHAIAAYQTATDVDSGFAAAYRELALTYGRLGEVDRASEARQTYLSLQGGMALLPMTRPDGPVMRPSRGVEAGIPPLSPP